MAFIGMGCTKEDRSECNTPILLKFKAVINVNGQEVEVGKEEVKELALYVFNAQEEFLEAHQVEIGSTITLSYPDHEELHLVCWGNSASEQQTLPAIEVGDRTHESLITLNTDQTRATQEKATTHPDDLFHAIKNIVIEEVKSSTVEMVLYHKIASVNITAEGLETVATRADDDYSYVLRSGKKHISFQGNTDGTDVHHYQVAKLINGIHESGIFNILPSKDDDNNIEVDIYKGTDIIATVALDSEGNIIEAKEGELLNIHAEFGGDGSIDVSVAITPWGEKKIWKDFD